MPSWLAEIAKNEGGRLRFDRFMELALRHPIHGYYSSQIRGIGKSGDFSTSTTLSNALGKAIFNWLEAEAGNLQLDTLIIIELGVGTGALAKGILSQRPCRQRKGKPSSFQTNLQTHFHAGAWFGQKPVGLTFTCATKTNNGDKNYRRRRSHLPAVLWMPVLPSAKR